MLDTSRLEDKRSSRYEAQLQRAFDCFGILERNTKENDLQNVFQKRSNQIHKFKQIWRFKVSA